MKIYIYCRVAPNDSKVAKNDKLKAQEQRCREFLKSINRLPTKVFYDEGDIHPLHLSSGIVSMQQRIWENFEQISLVVCDHEARFGIEPKLRKDVIKKIQSARALVLPIIASDK